MKKLLFFAVCALAVASCKNEQPKADLAAQMQRDSLNQIIAQKDNEINDMMSTFNEIEEGFRAISEAQNRVSIAQQGEGANSKQRIRENMQYIQSTMKQNRELINKLKQQLRESSIKGDALKRTIENLMKEMEEKDQQLMQLREELDAKDIHISELDEQVANLNTDVTNLTEESNQKTETINTQDKQLHTAWFVFGTKKELKEQHILEDGKVLEANFNKDYFTKIDIRVDKEIKFYSKSAEMMTAHPSNSYTLQRDANKQYVLRITDPQAFWSTSKYLVVVVK
jgi:predicted RNase H-like nuclease (RuvC/YqgF family)